MEISLESFELFRGLLTRHFKTSPGGQLQANDDKSRRINLNCIITCRPDKENFPFTPRSRAGFASFTWNLSLDKMIYGALAWDSI